MGSGLAIMQSQNWAYKFHGTPITSFRVVNPVTGGEYLFSDEDRLKWLNLSDVQTVQQLLRLVPNITI